MVNTNLRDIYLFENNWPGYPNPNLGIPTGGFDSTSGGNDVTVAAYPVGTKIQFYTDGTYNPGYTTMMYLRLFCISGQNDIDDLSSGYGIVGHCDASIDTQETATTNPICFVTNVHAATDSTQNSLVAIACGTMTSQDSTTTDAGTYGWFWVGGVCPYADITFFDAQAAGAGTDVTTIGGVAAGLPVCVEADTSQLVFDGGDSSNTAIGIALQDDA